MSAPIRASGRSRLTALFLTLIGMTGAHRFYLGKYGSGMLMALPILHFFMFLFLNFWSYMIGIDAMIFESMALSVILAIALAASFVWCVYDMLSIASGEMMDAEGLRLDWVPRSARPVPKRSQRVAIILCLIGFVGAHRFYTGQILYGLALLFTFGGLGIFWIRDMFRIIKRRARDRERRPLIWDTPPISKFWSFVDCLVSPILTQSIKYLSRIFPKQVQGLPNAPAGEPSSNSPSLGKRVKATRRPNFPATQSPRLPWSKSTHPAANRSEASAPTPPGSTAGNSSDTTSTEPVARTSSERRLPVYLLVDTSASMRGEPITAVNNGIRVLIGALLQDPYALETVHMSILTVGSKVSIAFPLTPVHELQPPEVAVPRSGAAHLGLGLKTLAERLPAEVHRETADRKADWSPYLFLMTRGRVSDRKEFNEQARRLREFGFKSIVGCLTGPNTRENAIKSLCDRVVALDTIDAAGFAGMFRWDTMAVSSRDRAGDRAPLPPPPREIRLDP